MVVIPLIPILTVCFSAFGVTIAMWTWLHSTYRKSTALYEHELERYETLHAICSGITTQEANQALTLMARAAISITPIEPYVPSEPEPRYEIVMHDEGMVSDRDEIDHGKVGEED